MLHLYFLITVFAVFCYFHYFIKVMAICLFSSLSDSLSLSFVPFLLYFSRALSFLLSLSLLLSAVLAPWFHAKKRAVTYTGRQRLLRVNVTCLVSAFTCDKLVYSR